MDIRRCGSASGSVTATTRKNAANLALVANHFSPFRRQPSPSRTAVVRMPSGSAPPCGSVMANVETVRLSSSGSSQRCFCSGVPYMARISELPVSGAWHPNTVGPKRERPITPAIRASLTCP